MSKPTKAKSSAERAKTPEALDADLQRALLRTAETCRQRFDENPTRHLYHLAAILEALARNPHLIDPVHRFMESDKCPSRFPGVAPVLAIGGVPVRRLVRNEEDEPIVNKRGQPVYQRIKQGRAWEGPSLVNRTRWAIEEFDADSLNVCAAVMDGFPPLLKADCPKWAETDAERVGLAIADLLADDGTGKRKQGWRDPEAVLRAILRELGHPKPDNLTR